MLTQTEEGYACTLHEEACRRLPSEPTIDLVQVVLDPDDESIQDGLNLVNVT